MRHSPAGFGGGFSSLIFWGVFAVIAVQVARSMFDSEGGLGGSMGEVDDGTRFCIAKVQVGLLGSARELQADLQRIAARADTSSSEGLHYVLQGGSIQK
jgi:uncharacterized membrane protein